LAQPFPKKIAPEIILCSSYFVIISRPEKFLEKAFNENGHPESVAYGNTMKERHHRSKCNQKLSSSDSESETDDGLFVNPNHIQSLVIHSDSSDDDEISGDDSSVDEDSDGDCLSNEDVPIKTIIDNNNTN
jgi:hypothetical protein